MFLGKVELIINKCGSRSSNIELLSHYMRKRGVKGSCGESLVLWKDKFSNVTAQSQFPSPSFFAGESGGNMSEGNIDPHSAILLL